MTKLHQVSPYTLSTLVTVCIKGISDNFYLYKKNAHWFFDCTGLFINSYYLIVYLTNYFLT